jgi:NAD(P)H-dependent FMN reductase
MAAWTASEIERVGGFELEVLDPAAPAIVAATERRDDRSLAALRRRIAGNEAFVVVTPEYNHSFTAPLKALIDVANREWQAKPVAFVSYGGISGGLRAVEHLRLVFAELHAVGIRDGVSFANVWSQFDEAGRLEDATGASAAAGVMLGRLAWWARGLTAARATEDYGRAAA